MNRRVLIVTLLLAAALCALGFFLVDRPLAEWVRASGIENAAVFVYGLGALDWISGMVVSIWLIGGIAFVLGAIGWTIRRDARWPRALVAAAVVQYATIATMIAGKDHFGRLRPHQVLANGDWSHVWSPAACRFRPDIRRSISACCCRWRRRARTAGSARCCWRSRCSPCSPVSISPSISCPTFRCRLFSRRSTRWPPPRCCSAGCHRRESLPPDGRVVNVAMVRRRRRAQRRVRRRSRDRAAAPGRPATLRAVLADA